jgi:ATP-binding cassette, subfamily B, bacterial AbcA/BmrA
MNKQTQQLLGLIRRSQFPKKQLVVVFLISIIETATALAVPLLTMNLINDFSTTGFQWNTIIIVAVVLILQAILGGLTYYLMRKLGERVVANLRTELWQHVLHLKVPFFDGHESGETMSRITQDTGVVKELVTEQLVSFVAGIFSIIGAVIVLLWIDWKMTLLMLIAVPITILATIPLAQKMNKIAKANQDELASFSGHLGRVLTNIRLVKTSQTEQDELEHGKTRIQHLYGFGLKEAKVLAFLSPIMTMLMMIVLIVIFGYGGAQVASGNISSGELVAIMIYLVQIIVPFTQMATFFTALQKALGATERITTLLEEPTEQENGKDVPILPAPIRFEDVHFKYHDQPILNGMTFTIQPNKTTAFVSGSGGGKTTMFSLIERFYHVTDGGIYYGNNHIETFNLRQWRSLFGYVSQEAPLMNGTVRENVLYGKPDATMEEVVEALKAAFAYDFVMKLENGIETEVGEGGIKLSGGQKQRIAIARALLRNPQILLLDEATSNLDNESEREVQLAINKLKENRTTVVIAHRLSTITHADQIFIFENGQLSGQGTHNELLQSNTYYDQLWSQANERY